MLTSLQWRIPINYILQHISLLSQMFFLLSWMLHVKHYEWNIMYSTLKLKCTNFIEWNKSTLPLLSEYSSQHWFYYPVTSYAASEWQKQKFWALAICIFYEQFFDLPQWRFLYNNLHAPTFLFMTFYSSWKVNIPEHLISTTQFTHTHTHTKSISLIQWNFEFSNPFL